MTTANKPIRSYDAFTTNIIGLPEGEYLTETMYSDTVAWKVVGRSATGSTLELQAVNVKQNPDWQPNVVAGGFAGHCTNQDEQTWLYDGLSPYNTVKVRLVKSNYCGSDKLWGCGGRKFIANGARHHHDYNF